MWRGAGIAIPVFSLRTADGLGVGEFLDLIKFVDLSVAVGSKLIQILPVNDTSCFLTWRDSYPYSSLSVFALHPLYLRVDAIHSDESYLSQVKKFKMELNKLSQIDYEAVMEAKWRFIRMAFAKEQSVLSSTAYLEFYDKNRSWLEPYIVFCTLRDLQKTANYPSWPSEYRQGTPVSSFSPLETHTRN